MHHAMLHEALPQQLTPQVAEAVPQNQLNLHSLPQSSAQSRSHPYHLYEEIGSGVFGTVYKAMHSRKGDALTTYTL